MKIMYLTTARHPEDYRKYLETNKSGPNPSNQNFHTKFINILRQKYDVRVLSSRPMAKKLLLTEERNDFYLYPGLVNIRGMRRVTMITEGLRLVYKEDPDLLFVDTLNVTLLKLAKRVKTLYGKKIIGIVTDNPMNLTGSKKRYAENIFKYSNLCDGYICLTEGLVRLFNATEKPHIVIPGFINYNETSKKETDEEYAFFAGALYAKYGVDTLIEAFRHEDAPYKLTIAGHGPLAETLKNNPHPNIEFIGHVTPEVAFRLAEKATVNINPRPADSQIDLFSVPSKVIDFISSGTVTISTENAEIRKLIGDKLYWIPNHEVETILTALKNVKRNYGFYKIQAVAAKKQLIQTLAPEKLLDSLGNLIAKL